MKGYKFYADYGTAAGRHKEGDAPNVVAVDLAANDDYFAATGMYKARVAAYSEPNSPTVVANVTPYYLRAYCRHISEAEARRIHPRLFAEFFDMQATVPPATRTSLIYNTECTITGPWDDDTEAYRPLRVRAEVRENARAREVLAARVQGQDEAIYFGTSAHGSLLRVDHTGQVYIYPPALPAQAQLAHANANGRRQLAAGLFTIVVKPVEVPDVHAAQ